MAVISNHIIIIHFNVYVSFHGSLRGLGHPLFEGTDLHMGSQNLSIFSHPQHIKQAIPERPAEPTVAKTHWSGQEATNSASLWYQRLLFYVLLFFISSGMTAPWNPHQVSPLQP
jgi:hypothetical protein